jgi:hypothetical protein
MVENIVEIPAARSIVAYCCKHDQVTLGLFDEAKNLFATASMPYQLFMKLVEKIINDHDEGGCNCMDDGSH